MTRKDIERSKDPDIRASLDAMRRAAARARELAERTGTRLVRYREGQVVYVDPRTERPVEPDQRNPA